MVNEDYHNQTFQGELNSRLEANLIKINNSCADDPKEKPLCAGRDEARKNNDVPTHE